VRWLGQDLLAALVKGMQNKGAIDPGGGVRDESSPKRMDIGASNTSIQPISKPGTGTRESPDGSRPGHSRCEFLGSNNGPGVFSFTCYCLNVLVVEQLVRI